MTANRNNCKKRDVVAPETNTTTSTVSDTSLEAVLQESIEYEALKKEATAFGIDTQTFSGNAKARDILESEVEAKRGKHVKEENKENTQPTTKDVIVDTTAPGVQEQEHILTNEQIKKENTVSNETITMEKPKKRGRPPKARTKATTTTIVKKTPKTKVSDGNSTEPHIEAPKTKAAKVAKVQAPITFVGIESAKAAYLAALDGEIARLTVERNSLMSGDVKTPTASPVKATKLVEVPASNGEEKKGHTGSFVTLVQSFLDGHAGQEFRFTDLLEQVGTPNDVGADKLRPALTYLKSKGRIASGGHGIYKSSQ